MAFQKNEHAFRLAQTPRGEAAPVPVDGAAQPLSGRRIPVEALPASTLR
jgi:hypothetical protein